ncbi:MAG: ribosome small subunit-dependent GTPase A [Planctomycetaceae bacterium]|nr:ribosome small subunit-dependent GTPase A [Planctomycetaceae bacterium]
MSGKKKRKIRTEFRKNREVRVRRGDLTKDFQDHGFEQDDSAQTERVSGKGSLSRKRTVVGEQLDGEAGLSVLPEVDESACLRGTVLSVGGLHSPVQSDDTGEVYQCATRRLLKTLSTDQRHVLAAGDRVLFRPASNLEGIIERIEPRHGVLCRTSRGRQHVMVANIDLMLIVSSAAEPGLKPHLIDRLLVTSEKFGIRPVICLNKIDLIDAADLQPLIGVYAQMGYEILPLSATDRIGTDRLRQMVVGARSVVVGQSGVGKSSLLNAIEPGLDLRVSHVSSDSEKGRHTTTASRLIPLDSGGYIVDTPGIRQFQLWDVIPEEVVGFCRDLRPYVSHCRFPDCTHTHEADCAIKDAVADGRLDVRRYESYCQMLET